MNSWGRLYPPSFMLRLKQASFLTFMQWVCLLHPYKELHSFIQRNLILPSLSGWSIYLLFFVNLSKQNCEVSRMQQKSSRRKWCGFLLLSWSFWFHFDNVLCTVRTRVRVCVCVCVCMYQHVSIQRTSLRCLIHHNVKKMKSFHCHTHFESIFIHILFSNKTVPNLRYIHQCGDQKLQILMS